MKLKQSFFHLRFEILMQYVSKGVRIYLCIYLQKYYNVNLPSNSILFQRILNTVTYVYLESEVATTLESHSVLFWLTSLCPLFITAVSVPVYKAWTQFKKFGPKHKYFNVTNNRSKQHTNCTVNIYCASDVFWLNST